MIPQSFLQLNALEIPIKKPMFRLATVYKVQFHPLLKLFTVQ